MMQRPKYLLSIAGLVFGCACAGGSAERPPPAASSPSVEAGPRKSDVAHRLVIAASGCWFGGVWRDALNETSTLVDRCSHVLEQAYGRVDSVRLERLRAVEAVEVAELTDRVRDIERASGGQPGEVAAVSALLTAVADAQRETMLARRAGDRIKKDIVGDRDMSKKPSDEREAVEPLVASDALLRLLRSDVGPFRAEAQTVGLLCAMDRMQTARGLPKHLKVYAVKVVFEKLFAVEPPAVPEDATVAMRAGDWLAYLSNVALAAGHPVGARAKSLEDRELMAWDGVLEGFADKLRNLVGDISDRTELRSVASHTVERLDIEYRASEAAILAERP